MHSTKTEKFYHPRSTLKAFVVCVLLYVDYSMFVVQVTMFLSPCCPGHECGVSHCDRPCPRSSPLPLREFLPLPTTQQLSALLLSNVSPLCQDCHHYGGRYLKYPSLIS